MNGHAVANEFAKMRHLRIEVVATALMAAVVGLALASVVSAPVDPASSSAWNALLAGMSLAVPLASPLLIAVLASRQVDIEHEGNGWLFSATSGLTPGGLCRSKFTALGIILAAATAVESILVLGVGMLLGFSAPVPFGQWLGFTICVLVVNLVLLAFHILFSARIDNQLVGLGIGMLGTLIAVFAQGLPDWLAHVTPWGYYALAQAADYQGTEIIALPLSYPSIAALGVLGAVLFVLITGRFDRQEA